MTVSAMSLSSLFVGARCWCVGSGVPQRSAAQELLALVGAFGAAARGTSGPIAYTDPAMQFTPYRRIIAVGLLVVLAGCAGSLRQSHAPPRFDPAPTPTLLYVVRRGWHIDICFAAADLREPLSFLKTWFPDAQYLVFGFGDRRYLVSNERNFPGVLAALWPGKGVILITGLAGTPAQAFGPEHVMSLPIGSAQAQSAQVYVWDSLSKTNQPVAPTATGPYSGSLYFSADPLYSALHTCNTWAAEVLKSASLSVRSVGTVLAPQLWNQVRRIAPIPRSPREEVPEIVSSIAGRLRTI
jgi:Protein of unknown function (DUF2459)